MKLTLTLLASVAMISSAYAYDPYGNNYSKSGNGYRGYNSNTGSEWSARSSGGTTYGTDSRGNNWQYNNNTGTYYNHGTGETRYRR